MSSRRIIVVGGAASRPSIAASKSGGGGGGGKTTTAAAAAAGKTAANATTTVAAGPVSKKARVEVAHATVDKATALENGAKLRFENVIGDPSRCKLKITESKTAYSNCYIDVFTSDNKPVHFMTPEFVTRTPKHHPEGVATFKATKGTGGGKGSDAGAPRYTNAGDFTTGNFPRTTPEEIALADEIESRHKRFTQMLATYVWEGPLTAAFNEFWNNPAAGIEKTFRDKILERGASDVALANKATLGDDLLEAQVKVLRLCGKTGQNADTHKHPRLYKEFYEAVRREFMNGATCKLFYPRDRPEKNDDDGDDDGDDGDKKLPPITLRSLVAATRLEDIPHVRMWLTRDAFGKAPKSKVKPPIPSDLDADTPPLDVIDRMTSVGWIYYPTRITHGGTGEVIPPPTNRRVKVIKQNSVISLGVRISMSSAANYRLAVKCSLDPYLGVELLRRGEEDAVQSHLTGSKFATTELDFSDFDMTENDDVTPSKKRAREDGDGERLDALPPASPTHAPLYGPDDDGGGATQQQDGDDVVDDTKDASESAVSGGGGVKASDDDDDGGDDDDEDADSDAT